VTEREDIIRDLAKGLRVYYKKNTAQVGANGACDDKRRIVISTVPLSSKPALRAPDVESAPEHNAPSIMYT
jgi:hypothetical protein